MKTLARTSAATVTILGLCASGALAQASWPSRSTPRSSTLGWFQAINAHNRQRLLYYVAVGERAEMAWAQSSKTWPKFSHLSCEKPKASGSRRATVRCTFHESASSTTGNPDTFWNVTLHDKSGAWLIDGYGQG